MTLELPEHVGNRPAGRMWLAVGCLGMALVPFLALGSYLGWANNLPVYPDPPPAMPNPNGFEPLTSAAMSIPGLKNPNVVSRTARPTLAELESNVRPNRPALRRIRTLLEMEYRHPPVRSFLAEFPYLARYRETARCFSAEAQYLRRTGDPDGAAGSAVDAVVLGSRVGKGGPLIHHLVGHAIAAIGCAALELCVPHVGAGASRRLGSRLDAADAAMPPIVEALEEERRSALAETRRMLQSNLSPPDVMQGGGPPTSPGSPLMIFWPKRWTLESMDSHYRATIAEARKPLPQRRPPPVPREPFTAILAPMLDQAGAVEARSRAILRLLRLQMALREHRLRTGGYPARLDDLEGVRREALMDPFSLGQFVYRRGRSDYLLYSVGPDFKDDGGTPVAVPDLGKVRTGDLVAGKLMRSRLPARSAPPPASPPANAPR